MENKNVYEKLQECRVQLQQMNLKKSGRNKFAGFNYYELADFLPAINELFKNVGLVSVFNIHEGEASLTIINSNKTEESVSFTSPIADANLKGCTPVQSLGGVHTYLKRYLYINALEIVENDMLDSKVGDMELEERVDLLNKFTELVIKTNTDRSKLYEYFEVNNNTEMTNEQIKEANEIMEKKGK